MIDLEALALARARELAQSESEWLGPLQQPICEKACTALSDGDIERLFSVCDAPTTLQSLLEGFADASATGESMPFQKWQDHLNAQGIELNHGARLWEKAWPSQKKFLSCLNSISAGKGHLRAVAAPTKGRR